VFAQAIGLVSRWPQGGGNITLRTATGCPIQTRGIEFSARPGSLTQGNDPAPFDFFIANQAAAGNVTLGVLGTPVTVDGEVELDIRVSASATPGDVSAIYGDGTNSIWLPTGEFAWPSCPLPTQRILVGSYPATGGQITVTATSSRGPVALSAIVFFQALDKRDERLIFQGTNPAPFKSFSPTDDFSVAVGDFSNDSTQATFDGSVTFDITVSGHAMDGDILGRALLPGEQISFPVRHVPEPGGELLLAVSAALCCLCRQRRRQLIRPAQTYVYGS